MDAHPPADDPHAKFRELCMLYSDFNRAVFLEEILNFIAGFGATKAELSAIRTAVQERTKQLAKRAQRGRPRAEQSEAWMQSALTAAYRKRVLGWSWSRVTESVGMKPTKPNIRTVQRRVQQYAEFTFDAVAPLNIWEPGQLRRKLRDGVLDSKRVQLQLKSKTGLPFDTRPEECKKLIEALLRISGGSPLL
jgi:hypothetical protein